MANIAIGSFYKQRMFAYQGTQEAVNTTYFQVTNIGAGGPVTEAELVAELQSLMSTLYVPAMCSNAQYVGTDIQNVTGGAPFPLQIAGPAINENGTAAPPALPAQVSGVVGLVTALTGPAHRGRLYIPFPSSVAVAAVPTPSPTAAYEALLAAIADQITGTVVVVVGAVNVTLEYQLGRWGHLSRTYTFQPTIGLRSTGKFGTQKRRGNYGRPNVTPVP